MHQHQPLLHGAVRVQQLSARQLQVPVKHLQEVKTFHSRLQPQTEELLHLQTHTEKASERESERERERESESERERERERESGEEQNILQT